MRRACSGIELGGHAGRWLRGICEPDAAASMTIDKNARRDRPVR